MNIPKPPPRQLSSVKSMKTLSLSSLVDVPSGPINFRVMNSPVHMEVCSSPPSLASYDSPTMGGFQQQPQQYGPFQSQPQPQIPGGCSSCAILPTYGSSSSSNSNGDGRKTFSFGGVVSEQEGPGMEQEDTERDVIVSTVEKSVVTAPYDVTQERIEQEFKVNGQQPWLKETLVYYSFSFFLSLSLSLSLYNVCIL